MRTTTKALLAILALVLLLLAGAFVWLDRQFKPPNPPDTALPQLVRDLSGQTAEIEPEFQRRVHARFPDGVAASQLAEDLRRDGFHLSDDRKKGLKTAVLEQHNIVCVNDWIIYWAADGQGRARSIGAHFHPSCL
jgi:hypothetical protein